MNYFLTHPLNRLPSVSNIQTKSITNVSID
jgi:hypothetical protein